MIVSGALPVSQIPPTVAVELRTGRVYDVGLLVLNHATSLLVGTVLGDQSADDSNCSPRCSTYRYWWPPGPIARAGPRPTPGRPIRPPAALFST